MASSRRRSLVLGWDSRLSAGGSSCSCRLPGSATEGESQLIHSATNWLRGFMLYPAQQSRSDIAAGSALLVVYVAAATPPLWNPPMAAATRGPDRPGPDCGRRSGLRLIADHVPGNPFDAPSTHEFSRGPDWIGLAWASLPLAACVGLLAWQRLGQVRSITIATVRLIAPDDGAGPGPCGRSSRPTIRGWCWGSLWRCWPRRLTRWGLDRKRGKVGNPARGVRGDAGRGPCW